MKFDLIKLENFYFSTSAYIDLPRHFLSDLYWRIRRPLAIGWSQVLCGTL